MFFLLISFVAINPQFDTSGVIVLSRNPTTTKRLGEEFKNRNIIEIC